ncbi:MAG: hypothetical protein Q4B23_01795 [Helcococcus sp.]|nr:hypothetical protein [Helcococcus sp.]
MKTKEIFEIVLSGIGLLVSVVAIWQSKKAIKLTEQSIKDANRPYVGISMDKVDTVYFEKFIMIKNYGNSSARVISIEFLDNVKKESFIKNEMKS